MSYSAKISWKKDLGETFVDNKYSRAHTWIFDGGIELSASSSPHVIPLPMSVESAVDPEEAFVASLSSCHMLWFLSIAAGKKYIVERRPGISLASLGRTKDRRYLSAPMLNLTPPPK